MGLLLTERERMEGKGKTEGEWNDLVPQCSENALKYALMRAILPFS